MLLPGALSSELFLISFVLSRFILNSLSFDFLSGSWSLKTGQVVKIFCQMQLKTFFKSRKIKWLYPGI